MPLSKVIVSALGMIVWGIIFFLIGVWRFNRRYR
jgi:ABC-type transport system involved in multi-copper enzyme maturation permease subunit